MDVLEAIRSKRAVRQFAAEPVPEEVVREIVNAGRLAQSSKNTQPWTFVVIRDRETLGRLAECGTFAGHLAGAAFAVAIVSRTKRAFDIGQAAATMQLAAWGMGVGSCIASMWEPERAREILGVPAELYLDTAISFGYPIGERERPARRGGRRPFDEVVRWERWEP